MAPGVFTPEQEKIIDINPIGKTIDEFRDSLPKDITFDRYILTAASDEDAMHSFFSLLSRLAGTKTAHRITLADSCDNLAIRLNKLAGAWLEQATFPTTLRSHCSSLFEKGASGASDLDVWAAVAHLLINFSSPKVHSAPTTPEKSGTTNSEMKSPILRKLLENWTSEYLPESFLALQDMLRDNEIKMHQNSPFYAKSLIFVQSSGMGKSRLADAFGRECPMINFILREEGTLGYPPADGEVLSFMSKRLSEEDQRKITNSPTAKPSSKRTLDAEKIANSPSSKKLKVIMPKRQLEEDQQTAAELSSAEESKPGKECKNLRISETEADFLQSMVTTVWNHSIAVGLLQASFEIFNAWVEGQNFRDSLKELAAIRHEKMAPYKHDSVNMVDWHRRSKDRINFCELVVSRAEEIADTLIQTPDWRHAFHDDRDSQVRVALESNSSMNALLKIAKKLIKNLKRLEHNDEKPLLVMVFDEASSLLKPDGSGNPDPGRYYALNRIISCLKTFPIWFFFLSTESQVGVLMPANDTERTGNYANDSSARIAIPGRTSLERFAPFLALQLDVEDRKRMMNRLGSDSKTKEIQKKMNEFAQPEHMAMFGRPLWFGYNPDEMNKLAKLKLVGGRQGTVYDAKNVHHVFAALSFRLSLDVCLQNPRTHPLARTAVNSFMRVVISMDQNTGVLDTITPSEPVVAKAAMEHLCEKVNWSDSIRTLTEELLDKGLIDKGLKGELYSRFLLILAQDWLRTENASLLKSVPTFTVQQFLKSLYAKDHYESILLLPSEILDARMNFNHFVPASENLSREVIPELLHDLLRRSAGMQLAHDQPTYDIMIPIYFGDPDEPFEVSCCGVIQVQVKNKEQATTPSSIFKEPFKIVHTGQPKPKAAKSKDSIRNVSNFVLNDMKNPVLFLLFDLGTSRKPKATSLLVEVSCSSGTNPEVWAIHSRGHDETVFGCLRNMYCIDTSTKFFTSLKPETNTHYKLCQRNKVFSQLGRNFRYSGPVTEHKRGVIRKRNDGDDAERENTDEDTHMEV